VKSESGRKRRRDLCLTVIIPYLLTHGPSLDASEPLRQLISARNLLVSVIIDFLAIPSSVGNVFIWFACSLKQIDSVDLVLAIFLSQWARHLIAQASTRGKGLNSRIRAQTRLTARERPARYHCGKRESKIEQKAKLNELVFKRDEKFAPMIMQHIVYAAQTQLGIVKR